MSNESLSPARKYADNLREAMGAALSEPMEFRGECSLTVLDASQLLAACRHARDELGFDMLTDLSVWITMAAIPDLKWFMSFTV